MKDKKKLIYILSSGRSGSTLLELLLHSHQYIWTLGELQVLPWILSENSNCGCGKRMKECEYWVNVLKNLSFRGKEVRLDMFREYRRGGKAIRLNELLNIYWGVQYRRREDFVSDYGIINSNIINRSIQEAEKIVGHNIEYVIDASKDPYRLQWLIESGRFEIYIVHLIRDPRAYVFSTLKNIENYNSMDVMKYAMRWRFQQQLYGKILGNRQNDCRAIVLRYEELCLDTLIAIDTIFKWLDCTYEKVGLHKFRKVKNHAVAGNPMRWESRDISIDDKWKYAMKKKHARIAWQLTKDISFNYGYSD